MNDSTLLPDSIDDISNFAGVQRTLDRWDPNKEIIEIISEPINPNPYNIQPGKFHTIITGNKGSLYALIDGSSILIGTTDNQGKTTTFIGKKGTLFEGEKKNFLGDNTQRSSSLATWLSKKLNTKYPDDYSIEIPSEEATVSGNIQGISYIIETSVSEGVVKLFFTINNVEYIIPSLGIEKNGEKWRHFLKVATDNTKLQNQIRKEFSFEDRLSQKAIEKLLRKIKSHLSRSNPQFQELRDFLKKYENTN